MNTGSPRSAVRRYALSFGLLLASLILALLLVEAVLRGTGFWFDVAPERVEFGWPDPVALEDSFARDSDLFWVTKDYTEKIDRLRRRNPQILFLGDSCTEIGEYPRLFLERIRAKHPWLDIEGGNLAVSGWSSYQGLRQLERDILPLRPRVVTLYFGWNDHWFGFGVEDKEIPSITLSRFPRLRSFRVAQLILKAQLAHRSLERKDLPERVAPEDFESNLRQMARLARGNGIVPVFLTAPTSHEPGREPAHLLARFIHRLDELVPLHQSYVSIVRRVAEEQGAVLCDLAARFAALPRRDVRELYFGEDGIHLKRLGDRKLADFLYACFEESAELQAIWKRPPPTPRASARRGSRSG